MLQKVHTAAFSFRQYLYFKPEGPCGGVKAVRIEDEIFSAQVELRRPVAEGPGGEAGSSVRHQVQRHVAGTCTGQNETWNWNFSLLSQTLQVLGWQDWLIDKLWMTNGSITRFYVWHQQAVQTKVAALDHIPWYSSSARLLEC